MAQLDDAQSSALPTPSGDVAETPKGSQDDLKFSKDTLKDIDVKCICGRDTQFIDSDILGGSIDTTCDICNSPIDSWFGTGQVGIFHCPDDKSTLHPKGFDICIKCVATKVRYLGLDTYIYFCRQKKCNNIYDSTSISNTHVCVFGRDIKILL